MPYKESNRNSVEKSKHENAKTVADANAYVAEASGYGLASVEKEKFNREYRHFIYVLSGTWIGGNILP